MATCALMNSTLYAMIDKSRNTLHLINLLYLASFDVVVCFISLVSRFYEYVMAHAVLHLYPL